MKKQPKRCGPEFYRYLARLTAPIALQNLITFSLGLIDTFMVSQLGNLEMAAVTTANVPVFLLISIVFGIQSGDTLLILGDEQTGIIVTKPDVIETAAAQIFEQMERQK